LKPTIGRVVHYRLAAHYVAEIESRRALRTSAHEILRGNPVKEGDTFPAMIVRVWGEAPESLVQLQVFLDGNDTLWATSVHVGEGPGTFSWPARD